jgi:hypothetical protein
MDFLLRLLLLLLPSSSSQAISSRVHETPAIEVEKGRRDVLNIIQEETATYKLLGRPPY